MLPVCATGVLAGSPFPGLNVVRGKIREDTGMEGDRGGGAAHPGHYVRASTHPLRGALAMKGKSPRDNTISGHGSGNRVRN